MCDTFAFVGTGGTFFAKNSDRPPDEVQVVDQLPHRVAGGPLHVQYLDLGRDPGAFALPIASQPSWLWGLEHGVNEHRVAIGNEAIYTTDDRWSSQPALLGMDLVRLALERARTAHEAISVLTKLIEVHGQGGSGWHGTNEPYFSSFLVADPRSAWILETSQRSWAAKRIGTGGVAISNRISLSTDFDCSSHDIVQGGDFQVKRDPKAPTQIADHRLAITSRAVSGAAIVNLDSIVATLRDHGPARPALPADIQDDWSGVSVCMHVRGYQATTSSLVSWLPIDPDEHARYWVALGSPCTSVFVPCFDGSMPAALSQADTWHRFVALRNRVETDLTGIDELVAIREVLDPLEHELWTKADSRDPNWSSFASEALDRSLRLLQV